MIRIYLVLVLIFSGNAIAETASIKVEGQTTYKIKSTNSYREKFREINPSLKIETGQSDNPIQLPVKDLDTSYLSFAPELSYNQEILKDRLFLLSNLKGDYKRFKDKTVQDIKGQRNIQLDLGLSNFITVDHEVGVTASQVRHKSSSLNFTADGLDDKGRDVRYVQNFFEAYYSFNQPKYFIELSGSYVNKKHDSLVQDDVTNSSRLFDEFKDDYTQVGAKVKINFKLSSSSQVFVEPTYSKRKYKERSARFTEGTTNQGSNPDLVELHRGVGIGYQLTGDNINLKLKTIYTKETDLIYKAHNANSYGLEAEVQLPVGSLFQIKTKYSWAQKDYTFFVTNPQQDPTSRDLRQDKDRSINIGLSKQVDNLLIEADYSKISKNSNYRPFNSTIGSVYDEDIFKIGLTLKL